MRKLLMVLVVLVLAAGMHVYAGAQQEGPAAAETDSPWPQTLEMTKAYYFGEPTDNPELKSEWMEYMSEQFGFEITVNAFPRPEYMQQFALAMTAGEIKGMGWIFGGSYFQDYANDGATLRVDQYLADNDVWNQLPEDMRLSFSIDGVPWAVADAWRFNMFSRSIRKDWLDNLGLELPENVDEFYEVMRAFTENDPDGNGQNDTVGMTSAGVWNMQDIFMAFDASTNHVAEHGITIDPNDGFRFVDSMLKPGMIDALRYLNDLYENGYLDKEVFTNSGSDMRTRMFTGDFGSAYYWMGWGYDGSFERNAVKQDPEADFVEIAGLKSDRISKNINPGGFGGTPWVLIAGTEEPGKVVNAFVNIFIGDEVGWASGRFGVKDKYWEFREPNQLVRLVRETVDGAPKYYPGPGIGHDNPFFSLSDYEYVLDGEDPQKTADRNARNAWISAFWNEAIENEIVWTWGTHPREPVSETYNNIGADIANAFEEAVAAAVTGQMSPEEAVEEYRRRIGNIGGQQVLDEANAYIGKESNPDYTF